jgi:hypothetical protein
VSKSMLPIDEWASRKIADQSEELASLRAEVERLKADLRLAKKIIVTDEEVIERRDIRIAALEKDLAP